MEAADEKELSSLMENKVKGWNNKGEFRTREEEKEGAKQGLS